MKRVVVQFEMFTCLPVESVQRMIEKGDMPTIIGGPLTTTVREKTTRYVPRGERVRQFVESL
jgi:hypothetical protein